MDPAANNRISTSSGYGYDATGNLTGGPGINATYDVQNRMATFVPTSGGTEYYSYGPDNMRVWKKTPSGAEEVYFYGALGEKLGRFGYGSGVFTTLRRSAYFVRLNEGQDRLDSTRNQGGYYPYGEAQSPGNLDLDRFATYYRDGTSLLDYARNRYYSSTLGRFMSADPYRASGGPADPGSWNRYAYVENDPVNFHDQSGLFAASVNCWKDCDLFSLPNDYLSLSLFMGLYASGGGGGGGGGSSKLDPQTTAYRLALTDAGFVKQGSMTDCQALASFATSMATLFSDNTDFVNTFGVFVPLKDPSVQYANSHGITMAANTKPVIMLPAGTGASGFDPKYQESIDKVNVDQVHHFAAFFELGYSARFLGGAAAAIYKDISPYNPGDINLGIAAANLGAELGAGLISKSSIADSIRNTLCKHQ